jgi:ribosomal protein L11 methyltransferase
MSDSAAPPREALFIYYLQGVANVGPGELGPDFLGNWQEADTAFLFFSAPAGGRVDQWVGDHPDLRLVDRFEMPYDQWHGDPVTPFRVGRLAVRPPWVPPPSPDGTSVDIVLDPGVVFGTGTHPTTADCLSLLDGLLARTSFERVLDLGTGTGLLAIAAAGLGCGRVLAVDVNPLAVTTARRNVVQNEMADRILTVVGRAETLAARPADLLMANLHHAATDQLIDEGGLTDKRYVLLSGLLRSEAGPVRERLARRSIRIIATRQEGGIWHTILGAAG